MNDLFFLFHDYTFCIVSLGSVLLGILCGVLGSFAVLRKQSLLGDGISHGALPGICAAFLITLCKNEEILLLGALAGGVISLCLITLITRFSKIKFDCALAMVLSVMFGLGLVFLTFAQKLPNSSQAGLKTFIYGQASAMTSKDVFIILISTAVVLVTVALFWKPFKLVTFDKVFSQVVGIKVWMVDFVLSFFVTLASVVGIKTVGVILMSAMLVAPAAAARQWVSRLETMTLLSAVIGAFGGVLGTAVSSSFESVPTGPVIVVCLGVMAVFSILLAPKRGVLWKLIKRKQNRKKLIERVKRFESSD